MTKQERKYLRALYHHFDDRQVKHTSIPDYSELVTEWKKQKTILKATYLILCMEGDEDNEVIPELDKLFAENNIEFID